MSGTIRIGTRGSPLALAQSELVAEALRRTNPAVALETVVIRTSGDKSAERGEEIAGAGKGVFVKEIEDSLREGLIDVAVHSMKDLPVDLPSGLILAAVLSRQDPRDAFVSREGVGLGELPAGARVATGSPRRQAQLKRRYPELSYVPIRGNIGTRLKGMREGKAEGVVLALAGLLRLGMAGAAEAISPEVCLPAPGQGAIGCEIRAEDRGMGEIVGRLNDPMSSRAVAAERAFLKGMGGGCRVPVAAYASIDASGLKLRGLVAAPDGSCLVQGEKSGGAEEAEETGRKLAAELLEKGAGRLLEP